MVHGTIFLNGRFRTLDPEQPRAEAMAVGGEHILAVGGGGDLRAAFPRFRTIDLRGRAVLPGIVDAHIHFASYGLSLRRVDLVGAATLGEAVARVKVAVPHARPGEWIIGRGWDHNPWPEDRFPNKGDLDPAVPYHPAVLTRKDGHVVWVNSAALAKAGITRDTPDPPGGQIERDAGGEPTGLLKEEARRLVWDVVPPPDEEGYAEAIKAACAAVHRRGVVGVHNIESPDVLRAMQTLCARGELTVRVAAMVRAESAEEAIGVGLRTGLGDPWLRIAQIKIFADGTLGSQTAWMLEPFDGQPGNTGIPIHSPDDLRRLVRRAVEAGFAVAIHAIGDRANREALDALEVVYGESRRRGLRHRIEHVQVLHPADLDRLAALGVVASMQPIHATSDRDAAERYWGRRSRYAYAWRTILDRGTRLAFGSDAPVESPDPFKGLYAAVTRQREDEPSVPSWYPEECLTLNEALRAYTVGAAYAVGEERIRGTLSVGRLADFMVLARDPYETPPEAWLTMPVEATVVGGRVVHAVGALSGME